MSKDKKSIKLKCHICGKMFDPNHYNKHHKNCIPK